MWSYIYIAPLQDIYSVLAYVMLNVSMNKYSQSVCKAKNSKLKESPVAGPRTHVEPANGFPFQIESWLGEISHSSVSLHFNCGAWSVICLSCCSHEDFTTIVDLAVGTHEYKYFVDGSWTFNPTEVSHFFPYDSESEFLLYLLCCI